MNAPPWYTAQHHGVCGQQVAPREDGRGTVRSSSCQSLILCRAPAGETRYLLLECLALARQLHATPGSTRLSQAREPMSSAARVSRTGGPLAATVSRTGGPGRHRKSHAVVQAPCMPGTLCFPRTPHDHEGSNIFVAIYRRCHLGTERFGNLPKMPSCCATGDSVWLTQIHLLVLLLTRDRVRICVSEYRML